MKKRVLILSSVLLAFSLTAYSFINWNQEEVACTESTGTFKNDFTSSFASMELPDLLYKVDSRFMWTITKKDLLNAKSIKDIVPKEATKYVETFSSSKVAILKENREEVVELGKEGIFNDAQLELLKTADYSTNFYVHGNYGETNYILNDRHQTHLIYYITVIPEQEASYGNEEEELINYLKESTKEAVSIITRDKLEPGQVSFTISKEGIVKDVKLNSTCGYASVDATLVDLVSKMPQKWSPATNEKGEKVEQEFVFFFGLEGC